MFSGEANDKNGFTIVELIIVVVVIGILAAMSLVSYSGVSKRAAAASLKSDLASVSRQLQLFQTENNAYPVTVNCAEADSGTNKCLKASDSTTYSYKISPTDSRIFCISATKNSVTYNVTQDGRVLAGPCPVLDLDADNILSYSGTGTVWKDLSGNDNNGAIKNGATYNGDYFSFDGVDDYILVTNNATLNTNDLTIVMKLYLRDDPNCDTNNNWRSLIHKGALSGGVANGFDIVLEESRSVVWDTGSSTPDRWPLGAGTMPMTTWTNLAVVYESNQYKYFYLNGSFLNKKAVTTGALVANASDLYISNPSIACPTGSGSFPGYIDEVRLYGAALSADEIKDIYEAMK